jgi:ribosome-binding factor A
MSKNEARLGRINEELMKAISHIITYELKNPDVTGMISVTRCKVTPDLKYAKVYVSLLNSKNVEKTMQGLKNSAGFIRSQVAKTINLRITPELVFEYDDSIEHGEKIDNILKEISKQDQELKERLKNK